MKKLLLALTVLFGQPVFAGEIDVMFMPETSQESTVSGEESSVSNTFLATSENAGEVFDAVKNQLESSFAGSIEASIVDAETGKIEKVEFKGRFDKNTQIYYIFAVRQNGQHLFWFEDSL